MLTIAHSWPKSKRQRSEIEIVFTRLLVLAIGVKKVRVAEVLAVTHSQHHIEHHISLCDIVCMCCNVYGITT